MTNNTLKKLNENLQIAIKDKNQKAIDIISKHIKEIESKIYVAETPKKKPCANKKTVVFGIVNKCIHMTIIEDKFNENRPCMGKKIKCNNSDCPIDIWYSAGCNALKCKFYTKKD